MHVQICFTACYTQSRIWSDCSSAWQKLKQGEPPEGEGEETGTGLACPPTSRRLPASFKRASQLRKPYRAEPLEVVQVLVPFVTLSAFVEYKMLRVGKIFCVNQLAFCFPEEQKERAGWRKEGGVRRRCGRGKKRKTTLFCSVLFCFKHMNPEPVCPL